MANKINLGKVAMTAGGTYDSTKAYDKLVCVFYDDCSWMSVKDVPSGVAPTADNSAYWQKISSRGAQGVPGQSYVDKDLVPIIDDLTTGGSTNVLSAEQGKVLKADLTNVESATNESILQEAITNGRLAAIKGEGVECVSEVLNGFISTTGNFVSNSGFVSAYIDVTPNKVYKIYAPIAGSEGVVNRLHFYSDKSGVGSIAGSYLASIGSSFNVVVPPNVKSISLTTTAITTLSVKEYDLANESLYQDFEKEFATTEEKLTELESTTNELESTTNELESATNESILQEAITNGRLAAIKGEGVECANDVLNGFISTTGNFVENDNFVSAYIDVTPNKVYKIYAPIAGSEGVLNRLHLYADKSGVGSIAGSYLANVGSYFNVIVPSKVKSIAVTTTAITTLSVLEYDFANESLYQDFEKELAERKIKGKDTDFLILDDQYNIFDKNDVVPDVYIKGTTGKETEAAGFFASGYIPVEAGKTYYMASNLARYWAFYDADKNYLTGEDVQTGYMTKITAPTGAAFFRFTMLNSTYLADAWMSAQQNKVEKMVYKPSENLVIPIELTSDELEDVKVADYGNIIDRSKLMEGYYISASASTLGKPAEFEGFACTDFCELEEGKTYHMFKVANFYAGFYDGSKKCIKVYTTDDRLPNPFTPPVGAKYARFTIKEETSALGRTAYEVCWCTANDNQTPNDFKTYAFPHNVQTAREAGVNPCEYTGREISAFRSLLCIGDSLTFGAENYKGNIALSQDAMKNYGYPAHLAKMSGVNCLNKGDSGKTTQGWYDIHSNDSDLAGHDGAIIMLGVNDWLNWAAGAPEVESYKTSLGRVIDLVIEKNSSSTGTNKIKVYVATIVPGISYLENSAGDSVDVLNNAIREVCSARADVILLDLAKYGSTLKKMAYNRGHLSAIGYWRMAADLHGLISKHIADNPDMYVDLAFIGSDSVQYEYSYTQW